MLDADERALLRPLLGLRGWRHRPAAEDVTGAGLDVLDRLVAKSLFVRRDQAAGVTRLVMLETIGAYAAEQLADDADHEPVRERHYRYYLAFALCHGTDTRALWRGPHGASRRIGRRP